MPASDRRKLVERMPTGRHIPLGELETHISGVGVRENLFFLRLFVFVVSFLCFLCLFMFFMFFLCVFYVFFVCFDVCLCFGPDM